MQPWTAVLGVSGLLPGIGLLGWVALQVKQVNCSKLATICLALPAAAASSGGQQLPAAAGSSCQQRRAAAAGSCLSFLQMGYFSVRFSAGLSHWNAIGWPLAIGDLPPNLFSFPGCLERSGNSTASVAAHGNCLARCRYFCSGVIRFFRCLGSTRRP
jgi:hypothetical protein